jgi:2-methylcitrate dehydratase
VSAAPDATLAAIVEVATETDLASVPARALELTQLHVLDTVACAAGGLGSPVAAKVLAVAAATPSSPGASVLTLAGATTTEVAGFVNGTLARCMDYNDYGPAGHPSDMVLPLLAVAEHAGASGADLLRGVFVAYEVATAFADAAPVFQLRWDMGLYFAAGAAAGMAAVLGLDPAATAHAVSMAVVPSVPLRVTRGGEGSEWRSAAGPHACMTAAFACRLAAQGLTGPPAPFEGPQGMFTTVVEPAAFPLAVHGQRPTAIERGSVKKHSACFQSQSGIDAAMRAWAAVGGREVERIRVQTSEGTWRYVGGGRGDREQRWYPTTRESADHSLPYFVANLFLDGTIDASMYDPARMAGRAWAPLIERIEVAPDEELTSGPLAALNPARVTVELADGSTITELSTYPWGEGGTTVVDAADVREKFDAMVGPVLSEQQSEQLHEALSHLRELADLDDVTRHLRAVRAPVAAGA